jgi:methylated-DNA-[protein]-cysteine S-methyltransferase
MKYTHHYDSPLGGITLASDGEALTGLWFDCQQYYGAGLLPEASSADLPIFAETVRWLDIYFSGREPDFTPPLQPQGTPFQMRVWNILLTIPYGKTVSYKDIAEQLAAQENAENPDGRKSAGKQNPKAPASMYARAVGGAVGHNRISLIIPCHRVIGSDGSLTGYAGGTERKYRLLEMENPLF